MSTATTHYILATAGHVDHGKSALVRALTGIDPDRLPEEKARGITIELGFAHFILPHPAGPPSEFALGVVDVPGHEDFVKNMVAGVGSIDLALLVIAADDGWMPQTEEHLQILDYLGVAHAIVALTKCDLVPDLGPVRDAVRANLADSPFATAPLVPTSVLTGEGLDELKTALACLLSGVPSPRDQAQPRLPIDRAFSLPGAGTIVTGTLTGGSLVAGQSIVIQPTGKRARIRALQNHGVDVGLALPGMRTALNIPDAPLASQASDGVARGQIVTLEELGEPTRTIDVELRRSGRTLSTRRGTPRPLKDGARVRLHHGSTNVAAKVVLNVPLQPGERALAQLRLEAPLFVLAGDRFILRDWAEQTTLAGGLILDLDASAGHFRTDPQQRFLRERARMPADPHTWILTLIERDDLCARTRLRARTRFSQDEIAAATANLAARNLLIDLGTLVARPDWWTAARARALSRVRQHHVDHPERVGLALTELRAALSPEFKEPTAFEALITDLCQSELSRDHATIREQTHTPSLPLPLQAAGACLRVQLAAKPLEPPSRGELTPDAASQQALRFLLDTGEAVSAGPELVLLASALARGRQLIRQHIRKYGPATASELRVALGTNRRVIIPLLEHFDRDGLTVREGDRRGLR